MYVVRTVSQPDKILAASQFVMSYFSHLSDEIILKILGDLTQRDLASCVQVSKRLRHLATDSSLYRELHLEDNFHISAYSFQKCISHHYAHLETISLTYCYWIPAGALANALQHCKSLREAVLTGCNFSVAGLNMLLANNPNLKKLGWSLPDDSIEKEIYTAEREPTEIGQSLRDNLSRVESLLLHFESLHNLLVFITLTSTLKLLELSLVFYRNEFFFFDGHEFTFRVACEAESQSRLVQLLDYNSLFVFGRMQTLQDSLLRYLSHAMRTNSISVLHAPGQYNATAWNYISRNPNPPYTLTSLNMDNLSLTPDIISWLGKLHNLKHLSLAHTIDFKSNLMRTIGSNSPKLQTLNLFGSLDWIDEDLCGLLSIANHCKDIRELNVGGIHYHAKAGYPNLLCKIISSMPTLTALSISACSFITHKTVEPKPGTSSFKPQQPSPLSKRGTRLRFSDTGYHRTVSAESSSSVTSSDELSRGSSLKELAESLPNISELEIFDQWCVSSRLEVGKFCLDSNLSVNICPFTRKIRDQDLVPVSRWKKLRKLTLVGFPSIGAFKSLVDITTNCSHLEYLSLSHIGMPGHSGSLSSLAQAVGHCQQLKMFRLHQPYYSVTEKLFGALGQCKKLEGICIISKVGKVCMDETVYYQLFDSCPRLAVFQMFCGESLKKCKHIEKGLIKRYRKARPPLVVTIATFSDLLYRHRLKDAPEVHITRLTRFQTRVAVVS